MIDVGVIGVAPDLGQVGEILVRTPGVRVTAIGRPARDASPPEALRDVEHVYDDFRQLVAEQELAALFLAGPLPGALDALRLAAEKSIPVWKIAPLARNFEEGLRLITMFDESGTPLALPRAAHSFPAWAEASKHWERIGRVFLVRAAVLRAFGPAFGWRGDRGRAGGGVLLHDGYAPIDLLIGKLGLPAEVSALTTRRSPPPPKFPYDSEDTALLQMHFSPQTLAALELCWLTTPSTPSVCFHGHEGSLYVSPTEWRCLDTAGAVRDSGTCEGSDPLEASIGEFLRSVESAERPAPLQPEARLAVLATIDAAYLSARTGEPVSPGRIFTMQGLRPERPAEPPRDAAADEPPV